MSAISNINKKWVIFTVLCLLTAVGSLTGVFQRLDLMFYDTCFRVGGIQEPGTDVVIIAIDDPSVTELGPFPWKRSVHGELLEKLKLAKVVGFDLTFEQPTDQGEDSKFAEAIARNGKVVLASAFSFEGSKDTGVTQVFNPPDKLFLQAAAGLGFVNIPTDIDGVVRRVSLVDTNTFENPFPSFGLAVALKADGFDQNSIKIEHGNLMAGEKSFPLDALNRAIPSFWGPRGSFSTYSYKDALQMPAEFFKNKIVLIGDTMASSHDYFSTPFTTSNYIQKGNLPEPGVELHASVVESFIQNRWYREVSPASNIAFLFLTGLLTTLVVTGKDPRTGLVGVAGLLSLVVAMVYGLWAFKHLWIAPTAPLFMASSDYAVLTSVNFARAELDRRRTKAVLRRYVSPEVAEELMQIGETFSLGGNRQVVTVMFCDIRGFTTYSENKDPEIVVKRLNQYLTAMTKVVFRYGGTLDKYLGDGLMAVFGAPVYHPEHVHRAVKAALEIQKEVDQLNRACQFEKEPPLKVGIGINSGCVLVGNVGCSDRMDYTVIGEDVNLASRMETLTKSWQTSIIISEKSVQLMDDHERHMFQFLGQAQVKGFSKPIGIFTVAEDSSLSEMSC